MDMKLGTINNELSKAFMARDKEIFAESQDREKKKKRKNVLKKKSNKSDFKSLFEDFHSIDLLG